MAAQRRVTRTDCWVSCSDRLEEERCERHEGQGNLEELTHSEFWLLMNAENEKGGKAMGISSCFVESWKHPWRVEATG